MTKVQVERQTDAAKVNRLLNDPRIYPWMNTPIDKTEQVGRPHNVFLLGDHGVCFFLGGMGGIYEVHTAVLPEHRGEWTNGLTSSAVDYMFLSTDCFEVITTIPRGHISARAAAIARGMRYEMTRPNASLFRGRKCDAHVFSYRIQDWAITADHFQRAGEAFHDAMHTEAEKLGALALVHAEDANHNKYVGIALEMARAGQLRKAVAFYNRWAAIAKFNPLVILRELPFPAVSIDERYGVIIKPSSIEVFSR